MNNPIYFFMLRLWLHEEIYFFLDIFLGQEEKSSQF